MRLPVEGQTEFQVTETFPDTSPVAIVPTVPEGVTRLSKAELQIPVGQGSNLFVNLDTADASPRFFLRGTDVPGGSVEIGAPGLPPNVIPTGSALVLGSTGEPQGPGPHVMLPGQRLDMELAVDPTTTAPVYNGAYVDELIQELKKKGWVWGSQIDLLNDANPSVVLGPSGDARVREVVFQLFLFNVTSYFLNRDTDAKGADEPHVATLTLRDTAGPDQVLFSTSFGSGESIGSSPPSSTYLTPTQSLEWSVAEPTVSDDPMAYWVFRDLI